MNTFKVTNEYSVDIFKHLSAPGVVDVVIPVSLLNGNRSAVRSSSVDSLRTELGIDVPGNSDHVIFVLEEYYSDCGWCLEAFCRRGCGAEPSVTRPRSLAKKEEVDVYGCSYSMLLLHEFQLDCFH
jgi:hypothetical protein